MNNTTSEAISTIATQGLVDIAVQHGAVVAILAALGVLALLNAVLKMSTPFFGILFFTCVVTPAIVIRSLYDKEYGAVVTDEIKDIREYIGTNPKAGRKLGWYFLMLLCIVIGILVYGIVYVKLMYGVE